MTDQDRRRSSLRRDIRDPACLPGLRRWLRDNVDDPEEGGFDAELVCTELVTNALEHGGGAGVVRILVEGARVCIEVDDAGGGGALTPGTSRLGVHRGRGLALVSAVARWGVVRTGGGKTVWAILPP